MKNIERTDIQIISRHSNLTEQEVDPVLKKNVYSDGAAWQKFFRLLFISLGVGFTVTGIVFFFAYNWADLHKFIKIGLTEGLLVATTAVALLPKMQDSIKNIFLTGASVLVGVLFAVFGQIYQTGANAYDFFLAWTVFITLWVLISNFAPLHLLYLVLINTTFILYSQQVAHDWSEVFIFSLLFFINVAILITLVGFGKEKTPNWLRNALALASVSCATLGIITGIFDSNHENIFSVLILITAIVFALGIWQGLKTKSGFYLSVIPFSLIIIVSALLVKLSDDGLMFLLISLFVISSVTLTIKGLIDLQKKWTNEK
jgi:uncharacterized membrane protein